MALQAIFNPLSGQFDFIDVNANLSGTNTGDVTLTAVGSTANANAASLAGQALNLQPANVTHPGVVTAIAQSFAGAKYFSAAVLGQVISLTDGATPALDASLGNVFYLAATANRTIAVPTNAPASGREQRIIIIHKAVSSDRTLSLNTKAGGFSFGAEIAALSATSASLHDFIGCVYNHVLAKWCVVAYSKGFS